MKGNFMKEFIYRRLKKSDYNEVQNLISDAFGLHDYVEDEKMLEKVKKYIYVPAFQNRSLVGLPSIKGK